MVGRDGCSVVGLALVSIPATGLSRGHLMDLRAMWDAPDGSQCIGARVNTR